MNQDQIHQLSQQMDRAIIQEMMPYMTFIIIGGIFWLVAMIDVIRSDFKNPNDKTTWIMLLIFAAPIGVILYPFMGSKQQKGMKYYSDTAIREVTPKKRHEGTEKDGKWF